MVKLDQIFEYSRLFMVFLVLIGIFTILGVPFTSAASDEPIGSFNKVKKLDVSSATGTPTVSKAQPIYLVDGDDSVTGTGEIVLDWSNISGESDIAVYDQNDALLPYEIESFDTTNKEAVLWVYNDWVRDGSTQAQIAYGDGPSSSQENILGAWSNSGQNTVMVQHLEDDPLSALDSSQNGNDGNVSGATATSGGQFNGAANFNGSSDEIELSNFNQGGSHSVVVWSNPNSISDKITIFSNGYAWEDGGYVLRVNESEELDIWAVDTNLSPSTTAETNFMHIALTHDSSEQFELYKDASSLGTDTHSLGTLQSDSYIGSEGGGFFHDGVIDEVRIYSEEKNNSWIQSDYDGSSKGGKSFYSQQSASLTDSGDDSGSGDVVGGSFEYGPGFYVIFVNIGVLLAVLVLFFLFSKASN